MEKRMNILVLGGTGFFGKHLVWELLHRGHEVTIATRGRTPDDFGDRVRRLHRRPDGCPADGAGVCP